jgi:hypothetical protein
MGEMSIVELGYAAGRLEGMLEEITWDVRKLRRATRWVSVLAIIRELEPKLRQAAELAAEILPEEVSE